MQERLFPIVFSLLILCSWPQNALAEEPNGTFFILEYEGSTIKDGKTTSQFRCQFPPVPFAMKPIIKITHSQIPSDLFVQRDADEYWMWVKSDAFKTKANMTEAEKAFKEKEIAVFIVDESAVIKIEKIIIVNKRETIWNAKPSNPSQDSPGVAAQSPVITDPPRETAGNAALHDERNAPPTSDRAIPPPSTENKEAQEGKANE
jgi:hypothetical protein